MGNASIKNSNAFDLRYLVLRLLCGSLIVGGVAWLLLSENKLVSFLALLCGCAGLLFTELNSRHKQVVGARWVAWLPLMVSFSAAWCLLSYTEIPLLAGGLQRVNELRLRAVRWEHIGAELDLDGQPGSHNTVVLSGLPQTKDIIRNTAWLAFPFLRHEPAESRTEFNNGTRWAPLDDGSLVITGRWERGQRLRASAFGTQEPVFAGGHCASYAVAQFRAGREYLISAPSQQIADTNRRLIPRSARFRLLRYRGMKLQLILVDGDNEVASVKKQVRRYQSLEDFLKGKGNEKIRNRLRQTLGSMTQTISALVFVARETPVKNRSWTEWLSTGPSVDLVIPTWTPAERSESEDGSHYLISSLVRAVRSKPGAGLGTSEGGAAVSEFILSTSGFRIETSSNRFAAVSLPSSGRLEIRYNLPDRFRLPAIGESGIKDSMLLSTTDSTLIRRMGMADINGKLEPQFIFDIGRPDSSTSRTVRLSKDRSSFKPLHDPIGPSSMTTSVNEEYVLGDGEARAIVALTDPVRTLSPQAKSGAIPLVLAGVSLSLALWILWNGLPKKGDAGSVLRSRPKVGGSTRSANEYQPTGFIVFGMAVWIATVGLLTTRAVLSLRASLQPPESATPGDLVAFSEAWNQAIFSLGLVPWIIGALLMLLVPKFNREFKRDRSRMEASVVAGIIAGITAGTVLLVRDYNLGVCLECATLVGFVATGAFFWLYALASDHFAWHARFISWLRPCSRLVAALTLLAPGFIGLVEMLGWQVPFLTGSKLVLLGIGISVLGAVLVGASSKVKEEHDPKVTWLWILTAMGAFSIKLTVWAAFVAVPLYILVATFQMKPLKTEMGCDAKLRFKNAFMTLRLSYHPLLFGAWTLLLGDPGTLIYMGPLVLCVATLFLLQPRSYGRKVWAGVLFAAFAFLSVPFLLSQASSWLVYQWALPIGQATIVPRAMLATPHGEERLWTDPKSVYSTPTQVNEVGSGAINSLQQRWQMLSYVQAPANRVRFLEAPFDGPGITEKGTLLSDAALSAFLISEHGRLSAFLLLVLVLFMGLSFLSAAQKLVDEPDQETRALGLVLVGAVLTFVPGYVALSNIWVVPFVGQNFPLLGLSSDSDLILFTMLIALGVLLMSEGLEASQQRCDLTERNVAETVHDPQISQSSGSIGRKRPLVATFSGTSPFILNGLDLVKVARFAPRLTAVAWCIWFGGYLLIQPRKAQVFALPKTLTESMERKVANARKSMLPNALGSEFAKRSSIVERLFYNRFLANRQDTILLNGPRGIVVSPGRFVLDPLYSEPSQQLAWQGRLLLTNSSHTESNTLQMTAPFLAELPLGSVYRKTVISLSQEDWVKGEQGANRLSFRAIDPTGRSSQSWDFGSIEAGQDGVFLEWDTSSFAGLSIKLNGQRLPRSGDDMPLEHGDQVTAIYTVAGSEKVLLNVSLGSTTERSASGVALQNGKRVRVYPLGADFAFAAGISEAYEVCFRSLGSTELRDRMISIDESLHMALQTRLKSWQRRNSRPISRLIGRGGYQLPVFTAITILDSFTGKLLALPSLPHTDPNFTIGKAQTELVGDQPRNHQGRERDIIQCWRGNWNLRSMTVGSTIKPLTFAALSEGLNGPGFNLSLLGVNEASGNPGKEGFTRIGNINIREGDRGLMSEEKMGRIRTNVGMREYLRDSRTYPAAVTAFLGLGEKRDDVIKYIKKTGSDIYYCRSSRSIDLDFRSGISGVDLSAGYLDDTVILKTMRKIYGPFIWNYTAQRKRPFLEASEEERAFIENYLPETRLDAEGMSRLRVEIFPDYHLQNTPCLTSKLNLARYFIGAGNMQWSTMLNAVSFARITVGRRISPTFRSDAPVVQVPSGSVIGGIHWRESNLLNPLGRITTLIGGSLREFNDYQADIYGRQTRPGFRIVAKTGTVNQGDDSGYESELVSFTAGYFDNDWIPGQTVSGSINIRAARLSNQQFMRYGLLREVVAEVKPYVARLRRKAVTRH